MPASVMQRAETVLLNISSDLRTLQNQAFEIQDHLARRTNDTFIKQKSLSHKKFAMEVISLAGNSYVAINPAKVMQIMRLNEKKDAQDIVGKLTGAISSIAFEPANLSIQADAEKLKTGQQELSAFFNSLSGIIQTHDTALQRLQNMEGANRQG